MPPAATCPRTGLTKPRVEASDRVERGRLADHARKSMCDVRGVDVTRGETNEQHADRVVDAGQLLFQDSSVGEEALDPVERNAGAPSLARFHVTDRASFCASMSRAGTGVRQYVLHATVGVTCWCS